MKFVFYMCATWSVILKENNIYRRLKKSQSKIIVFLKIKVGENFKIVGKM